MRAASHPPAPTDLASTDAIEDAATTILQIRDIEVAAARIALTPCHTKNDATRIKATPITRCMGINLAHSIRHMAQIVANSSRAQYFTTAESCRRKGNYRLQVWKLPENHK